MTDRLTIRSLIRVISVSGWLLVFGATAWADKKQPELDIPFEPTPPQVIEEMLKLAQVNENDFVYDLGCGDGRIVIAAARTRKARGFGVDLDPQRIEECKENAQSAGVADRVEFKVGDMLQTDVSRATVVMLYVLEEFNLKLRPILFRQLRPGSRVVSHAFSMGGWKSDKTENPPKARDQVIYLWIMPASVGGVWQWTAKTSAGESQFRLELQQEFQDVQGTLVAAQSPAAKIQNVSLRGREFAFTALVPDGSRQVAVEYKGIVDGDTIKGAQKSLRGSQAQVREWTARRLPTDITGSWRIKVQDSPEPMDGLLRLEHKDGILKGAFTADNDTSTIALPGLITWGTSIYFDIPGENEEEFDQWPIFSGVLQGQGGSGTLKRKGWAEPAVWQAQRQP